MKQREIKIYLPEGTVYFKTGLEKTGEIGSGQKVVEIQMLRDGCIVIVLDDHSEIIYSGVTYVLTQKETEE